MFMVERSHYVVATEFLLNLIVANPLAERPDPNVQFINTIVLHTRT